MPNWCENRLTVYSDGETREKILAECLSPDEYGKPRLDFEKIIPVGDTEDWYNQHIEKWGTKWNSTGCVISDENEDRLEIDMMTAWSPPVPIAQAIAEKYQCDTRLEYYEPGIGFRGVYEGCPDGEVREDRWDMTREDFAELGFGPENE